MAFRRNAKASPEEHANPYDDDPFADDPYAGQKRKGRKRNKKAMKKGSLVGTAISSRLARS